MFDVVAPFYDFTVGRVVSIWAKWAADLLGAVDGLRILDLCTGTGIMARELVRRKAVVTGIDRSRNMLARATRACPEARFLIMDMRQLDLPEVFDAVTISMAMHELPPAEMVMVLRNLPARCRGKLLVLDWARRPDFPLSRWLLDLVERAEGSHYQEYMGFGAERIFSAGGYQVRERRQLTSLVDAWLLEPATRSSAAGHNGPKMATT